MCGEIYARVYCIFSACTMSSQRKFTFAISSPDEFLVHVVADIELVSCGQYNRLVDVAVVLSIMMAMMMMMMTMQLLKSEKLMVLKINRVFPQHFCQYYFHAFNDAGSDEVKLILDRQGQLHASFHLFYSD